MDRQRRIDYLKDIRAEALSLRINLKSLRHNLVNAIGEMGELLEAGRMLKILTPAAIQERNQGIESAIEKLSEIELTLKDITYKEGDINIMLVGAIDGLIEEETPKRVKKLGEYEQRPIELIKSQHTLN